MPWAVKEGFMDTDEYRVGLKEHLGFGGNELEGVWREVEMGQGWSIDISGTESLCGK